MLTYYRGTFIELECRQALTHNNNGHYFLQKSILKKRTENASANVLDIIQTIYHSTHTTPHRLKILCSMYLSIKSQEGVDYAIFIMAEGSC